MISSASFHGGFWYSGTLSVRVPYIIFCFGLRALVLNRSTCTPTAGASSSSCSSSKLFMSSRPCSSSSNTSDGGATASCQRKESYSLSTSLYQRLKPSKSSGSSGSPQITFSSSTFAAPSSSTASTPSRLAAWSKVTTSFPSEAASKSDCNSSSVSSSFSSVSIVLPTAMTTLQCLLLALCRSLLRLADATPPIRNGTAAAPTIFAPT
mmetsp:Transcript_48914/g.115035  ORF Transcript_48914/g.115035 Transcript_48914/m.115035 type:complete len:208 (+) Transcript_48914:1211-1834(+)